MIKPVLSLDLLGSFPVRVRLHPPYLGWGLLSQKGGLPGVPTGGVLVMGAPGVLAWCLDPSGGLVRLASDRGPTPPSPRPPPPHNPWVVGGEGGRGSWGPLWFFKYRIFGKNPTPPPEARPRPPPPHNRRVVGGEG